MRHISASKRSRPIFRPFAALLDLGDDPHDERGAVWRMSRDHYTARVTFDAAALAYALGGLMLGALAGQLILGSLGALGRVRHRRRRRRMMRAAS